MYRRSSKRRQIVVRSLVYAFMTVSVLSIVAVLMLIILGYSFNRQDGRLEQGGLLQFASIPSGAAVTLDSLQTGSRTPSKASVDAKSHHTKMDLKGYRTWQKTIAVEAGGIGWLSYARLVPTEIKPETVRTFTSIEASLASKDRKWIIAQESVSANAFTLINVESDTPKFTTTAIPEAALTPAATPSQQQFSLVAWSRNDDRFLVKRTYDTSKTEWIVVDRQNVANSVNLTATFGIDATDVQFGERSGDDAYALTSDGIVRRIDFGDKTLSSPLAENVSEYSVFDYNTLLYVTNPDGKETNQRHVGYRERGMDKAQAVFSYPAETTDIHVAFGEYYGKDYVSVTHGLTQQVFVGSLPRDETKANLRELTSITLPSAPVRLSIGENGRFAVAEMADAYTTYDIELSKTDTTTFTKPAAVARQLEWLDGYLIASDRGGLARFYEFDGGNQQDIMPVIEGQAMTLTGNEKFFYGFSATADGAALTRARMVIN